MYHYYQIREYCDIAINDVHLDIVYIIPKACYENK